MIDALTSILDAVRMNGSLFSRAELDAPWAVRSGTLRTGVFHAVVRGSCWLRVDGCEPIALERGDVVLLPFGDDHIMADRPDRDPAAVGFAGTTDASGMGRLEISGPGPHTSLLCGSVDFASGAIHPMLSLLPRVIHVPVPEDRGARWVETCVSLMHDEVAAGSPGSETVIARLTDVLVVYTLRRYLETVEPGDGGWLGALADPVVGPALDLIHDDPARSWTVASLAAKVGSSRSGFHQRFRELVGETPGDYMTRWRMQLATGLLRDEQQSVASVARRIGYSTEAAFSNAFLRVVGVRPGAYRRSAA